MKTLKECEMRYTAYSIQPRVDPFYRQFTLSEVIDQGKIDAQLTDGVLRLSLTKVQKTTPCQIKVNAG